jgi:predicted enzyme related to lactoylglutathione lyase
LSCKTGDIAKAKEFYSQLFDWQLEDIPMPGGGDYTMINVGEGTGGGMITSQSPGTSPQWLAYLGVDDD